MNESWLRETATNTGQRGMLVEGYTPEGSQEGRSYANRITGEHLMERGHLHPFRTKRTHRGNEECLQSLWPTRSVMPGEDFMASAVYNIY